jgi:hypothetical protein
MSDLQSDETSLNEAEYAQDQTKDAILRIKAQLANTEDLAVNTLSNLYTQRTQTRQIELEMDRIQSALDQTIKLQNRFDRWNLHWGGRNMRQAKKEAKIQMKGFERQMESIKIIGKVEDEIMTDIETRAATPKLNVVCSPNLEEEFQKLPLDQEFQQTMARIHHTDKEVDDMLGGIKESIDRLQLMSLQMHVETECSAKVLNKASNRVDKAHGKQLTANGRLNKNLLKP